MLSIHYVSIVMRIFYIDWQQHWECDRTMNIGDQQKSHKWQTSVDQLTVWQLGFQWHRRGIERVFKSLDCFTKRLFHTATIFFLQHMYLLWVETSPGWSQGWRGFFYIPRTEGSGDVMVLRQSRPPSAVRRPPPAARNGVNAITQKPLDGLFSNLLYTLVVIVSWPD